MTTTDHRDPLPDPDRLRHAEAALRRLGFSRVAPVSGTKVHPEFWVQEAGVPRRRFPVFLEAPALPSWGERPEDSSLRPKRAIVVVSNEKAADDAWRTVRLDSAGALDAELSVLVVPNRPDAESEAHWHVRTLTRRELLQLATGVVVGLFRRAETGDGPVDFSEMLQFLRQRFSVDVHRSLGVEDDEDALFLLYQLAQRFSWAPGDGGATLHTLVLKPTGPAARLPWFAA